MSNTSELLTPYEQFLRQNLESEKSKAESLAQAYSKARGLRKIALKRQLDQLNQNIQILSNDVQKYLNGLEWLREPTKERDEKAEHLKPVAIEAITGQAPKPTASAAQRAAPVASTRPQIGTPVSGQARPTIGQPKPAASTAAPAPSSPPPIQNPPPARPAPTATGRPRIGTPVGTPVAQTQPAQTVPQNQTQERQPSQTQDPPTAAKRPTIGTPIAGRPRIGTPIGTQQTTENSQSDNNNQESSEGSS